MIYIYIYSAANVDRRADAGLEIYHELHHPFALY
jgi:hypothetical protein